MLKTERSKQDESMRGWPIDGEWVKRQVGMIYWYSWGEHEFDIRVMRAVLGMSERDSDDQWFMQSLADRCGSFCRIMKRLDDGLQGRKFADAMRAHDAWIEAGKCSYADIVKAVADDIPF